MNVASLELCKELYELSGWDYSGAWIKLNGEVIPTGLVPSETDEIICPAYDLGYLLRKLEQNELLPQLNVGISGWDIRLMFDDQKKVNANTPEDAAAKLAIELFKQGALSK